MTSGVCDISALASITVSETFKLNFLKIKEMDFVQIGSLSAIFKCLLHWIVKIIGNINMHKITI